MRIIREGASTPGYAARDGLRVDLQTGNLMKPSSSMADNHSRNLPYVRESIRKTLCGLEGSSKFQCNSFHYFVNS